MHLVGFIIRVYHDARAPERQIPQTMSFPQCEGLVSRLKQQECRYTSLGKIPLRSVSAECAHRDDYVLVSPFVALRNTSREKSSELSFRHLTLVQNRWTDAWCLYRTPLTDRGVVCISDRKFVRQNLK